MDEEKIVKVIIATHKIYPMPEDEMYIPLHVGAAVKKDRERNKLIFEYEKDNTGDNISALNPSFCELTALYWVWKNIEADYIGLVHYRRHFALNKTKDTLGKAMTYKDIEPYLGEIKVFVPNKRRYYIETLYSHYAHTHYAYQLDMTRLVISEKYPYCLNNYDKVIKRRYGYMFNMMIMERGLLNDYCSWLFDILFGLRMRLGSTELSAFQGRFYGRVSEIIFNVWLDYQLKTGRIKISEIKEISVIHMEKINWRKKGAAFLKAKFLNQKYEESF